MDSIRTHLIRMLRWSEKYTKTDMVKLVSGGSFITAGYAIAVLSQLGLAIGFGHLLEPTRYGTYRILLELYALINVLAPLGIANELSRDAAQGVRLSLARSFALTLRWSWPTLLGALAVVGWFALRGESWVLIALVLCTIPLQNASMMYSSYLLGARDFKRVSLYTSTITVMQSVLVLGTLLISHDPYILFGVYGLSGLGLNIIAYRHTKKRIGADLVPTPERHDFKKASIRQTLLSSVTNLVGHADALLIAWLLGPFALATYTYATGIPDQIRGMFKAGSTMLFPAFVTRPGEVVASSMRHKMLITMIAAGIVGGIYVVLAPLLFSLLFPLYVAAVPYSQWYAISVITVAVFIPLSAINARGEHNTQIRHTLITNGTQLALYCVLIPLFNIDGALLAIILGRIYALWYAYRLAQKPYAK